MELVDHDAGVCKEGCIRQHRLRRLSVNCPAAVQDGPTGLNQARYLVQAPKLVCKRFLSESRSHRKITWSSAQSEADAEYARSATLPPLQSVMELTSAWRAPARGTDPDAVPSASPGRASAQMQPEHLLLLLCMLHGHIVWSLT